MKASFKSPSRRLTSGWRATRELGTLSNHGETSVPRKCSGQNSRRYHEPMTERNAFCLRCTEVELVSSGRLVPDIEFFDCPGCQRRYARETGRSLTFRWLHPISLVLYTILFDVNLDGPARSLLEAAQQPPNQPEEARRMIGEIELELAQPTQQVRDILDNPQTEEQCRQFLREYVARVRTALGDDDGVLAG